MLLWVLLAIAIIVVSFIYAARKNSVTLSLGQARLARILILKELKEVATEMHNMVDKVALKGKVISVDSIFKNTKGITKDIKKAIKKYRKALLEKYGPTIPVNTVQQIVLEIEDKGRIWSDKLGCFERHLQRRDGNLLFPRERRFVTKREIEEAIQKDMTEQHQFTKKVRKFAQRNSSVFENDQTFKQASETLKEIQAFLAEAASIGGDIDGTVRFLEKTEDGLMNAINKALPEGTEQMKLLHSYAVTERSPYFAQLRRKDSPIRKEEEIPTLLTEDLETIAFEGYKSSAFGPDYGPSEMDIKTHLERVVREGFSQTHAARIINAWNEGKMRWIQEQESKQMILDCQPNSR